MSAKRLAAIGITFLLLHGCSVAPPAERAEQVPAPASGQEPATEPGEAAPVSAKEAPLVVHRVSEGETLFEIARYYGVNTGSLARRNHLADPNFLEIGERLVIPSADGNGEEPGVHIVRRGESLSRIAQLYGLTASKLQEYNHLEDPDELEIGDRLFIPGSALAVTESHADAGFPYIWPLSKMIFLSEFGNRGSGKHNGVDLGAPRGTPIRAAAGGMVTRSGWLHGYGQVVVLEHEGGVQTLYAHNQKNLVTQGQRVLQGETIATIGHTGNASGYHVHFEYILDGTPVDPRDYLPEGPD